MRKRERANETGNLARSSIVYKGAATSDLINYIDHISHSIMAQMNFVSNWEGVESVPESYIWPQEKRPGIALKKTIPVLDFATQDRALLFQKILDSTHEFGVFQV